MSLDPEDEAYLQHFRDRVAAAERDLEEERKALEAELAELAQKDSDVQEQDDEQEERDDIERKDDVESEHYDYGGALTGPDYSDCTNVEEIVKKHNEYWSEHAGSTRAPADFSEPVESDEPTTDEEYRAALEAAKTPQDIARISNAYRRSQLA